MQDKMFICPDKQNLTYYYKRKEFENIPINLSRVHYFKKCNDADKGLYEIRFWFGKDHSKSWFFDTRSHRDVHYENVLKQATGI